MTSRLLRPLAAALVLGAALGLPACSSNSYDAETVESYLKDSQEGKVRGLALGDAVCPEDVELTEGVTFRCTLEIAGVKAPYTVRLTNVDADKIRINLEPAKALIATAAVVDLVRSGLKPRVSGAGVDHVREGRAARRRPGDEDRLHRRDRRRAAAGGRPGREQGREGRPGPLNRVRAPQRRALDVRRAERYRRLMRAGQPRRERQPVEESPDIAGHGGRGTDPGKPAGKCHRNTPPMAGWAGRPPISHRQG